VYYDLCRNLFTRCEAVIDAALASAGLTDDDMTAVVLIGGSSVIPRIKTMLEDRFPPRACRGRVCLHDPRLAVVTGAALFARRLKSGADVPNVEVGVVQQTPTPCPRIADICPLSLGIRIELDKLEVLIPRGTSVPFRSQGLRLTQTVSDQTETDISVYEGNRPLASENRLLGSMHVTGLPRGMPGEVAVTVFLGVNENGVLELEAATRDRVQKCELRPPALSSEELQRSQSVATAFAEQDQTRLQETHRKFRMESLCQNIQREIQSQSAYPKFGQTTLQWKRKLLDQLLEKWTDPDAPIPSDEDIEVVKQTFIKSFLGFYRDEYSLPTFLSD
jgi:molecular chaperone DnaK (HSP70)